MSRASQTAIFALFNDIEGHVKKIIRRMAQTLVQESSSRCGIRHALIRHKAGIGTLFLGW